MSMIDEIRSKLAAQDLERYLERHRVLLAARRIRPPLDPWLLAVAFVMGLAAGTWIGVSL